MKANTQKAVGIFGSTGSIGTQTLNIIERDPSLVATVLVANKNVTLLEEQIRTFSPEVAVLADEAAARDLKARVADTATQVWGGSEAVLEAASWQHMDVAVAALVGIAGLLPTLRSIEAGVDIALANKETLVTAGDLVMQLARAKEVSILPVDSEHSAIFQCLQGGVAPKKIWLTASGGAFFGKTREELVDVTPKEALRHPNWDMGAKVTIDSSTLMNKGLEVIEATHLFGVTPGQIEVVVHRQSIVHSMVEFCDNSILAQLGAPDMRTPISYALHYPRRSEASGAALSPFDMQSLTFERPDMDTFSALRLAYRAIETGGTMPVVLNGAGEVAVSLFLQEKCKFLQMAELVEAAMDAHKPVLQPSLQDILDTNEWVKEFVNRKA